MSIKKSQMKAIVQIIILILATNNLFSQNSGNFIYLFSGDSIYSKNINDSSRNFLLIGDKKILKKDIKFFSTDNDFLGNITKKDLKGTNSFASRVIKGNINLFKKLSVTYGVMMPNGSVAGSIGSSNYFTTYYYNTETFGNLKKAKYKNLKTDLSSNVNSMLHLKKFKSVKQRGTILYIVGGIITILGSNKLVGKEVTTNGQTPDIKKEAIITGIGVGTLIINYLTTRNKNKHIIKAIQVFND